MQHDTTWWTCLLATTASIRFAAFIIHGREVHHYSASERSSERVESRSRKNLTICHSILNEVWWQFPRSMCTFFDENFFLFTLPGSFSFLSFPFTRFLRLRMGGKSFWWLSKALYEWGLCDNGDVPPKWGLIRIVVKPIFGSTVLMWISWSFEQHEINPSDRKRKRIDIVQDTFAFSSVPRKSAKGGKRVIVWFAQRLIFFAHAIY